MLRATLALCVLPMAAAAAQVVDGRVINASTGTGIPGVDIILGGGGNGLYRATTDAEGRFRIEEVEDGTYTALYRARGYWPIPFAANPRELPPILVTDKGGPVHLESRMQPIPKIFGRVLDSLGKPVNNAEVFAYENPQGCNTPSCFSPPKRTKTGENGEYRLDDFDSPGKWVISAIAPESLTPPQSSDDRRLGWQQTFYPGVADQQLAAWLTVQPGADISGMDFKLASAPVHLVRGRAVDEHGQPAKATVLLYNGLGAKFVKTSSGDGSFELGPAGEGRWQLSGMLNRTAALWAVVLLDIKGRDIENLELRLAAPFVVQGNVLWETPGGVAPPDLPPDVVLVFKGSTYDMPTAPRTPIGRPGDNGSLTFSDVYPGDYEIVFLNAAPPPFYLDSICYGSQDAMTSFVHLVSDGPAFTATFKFGGGTVQGAIEGCTGAHVALVPRDPALRRPDLARETRCGPGGHFEFTGVRPGEYYGLAIADGPMRWFDGLWDDAVIRQAVPVTVRANEHTSADIRLVKP
jgi:hypothetical protein